MDPLTGEPIAAEIAGMDRLTDLGATLSGMLSSPITLVSILLTFAIALWRPWWWVPGVLALIADVAATLLLYRFWQSQGIDVTQQFWRGFVLFGIITYAVFLIARLLMLLVNRVEPAPPRIDDDRE
jgi:hypothetical protein